MVCIFTFHPWYYGKCDSFSATGGNSGNAVTDPSVRVISSFNFSDRQINFLKSEIGLRCMEDMWILIPFNS